MQGDLYITGRVDADALLNGDATALLIGMLLDQQVPMEWAFMGPDTLRSRLGHLDAARIAALDENQFVAVCCDKPAIHRFPAVMARRIHASCVELAERHDGDVERLWSDDPDGAELYRRLRELPGFGDEKARIFIALIAKRFGIRPKGWELSGRSLRRRPAENDRRLPRRAVVGKSPRVEASPTPGQQGQARQLAA